MDLMTVKLMWDDAMNHAEGSKLCRHWIWFVLASTKSGEVSLNPAIKPLRNIGSELDASLPHFRLLGGMAKSGCLLNGELEIGSGVG